MMRWGPKAAKVEMMGDGLRISTSGEEIVAGW